MADKMWAVYGESGHIYSIRTHIMELPCMSEFSAGESLSIRQVVVLPVEEYEALTNKPRVKVVANDTLRDIVEEAHEAGQRSVEGSSNYTLANHYCTQLFSNTSEDKTR
jgi:hypothetical protein